MIFNSRVIFKDKIWFAWCEEL